MTNVIQLDSKKVNMLMANCCVSPHELSKRANIHYNSYLRITKGYPVKPLTAGKIARALNCKVEDLL